MNTLYQILQPAHSGFRWISLLLLIYTAAIYFIKWRKASIYTPADKKLFTINLSVLHLQVLIGIVLYFISPKVQFLEATMSTKLLRFFTVEHAFMMLISVVLVTIASSKLKKKTTDTAKFKTGFWFVFIALVIILLAIPWPFQALGAGWF